MQAELSYSDLKKELSEAFRKVTEFFPTTKNGKDKLFIPLNTLSKESKIKLIENIHNENYFVWCISDSVDINVIVPGFYELLFECIHKKDLAKFFGIDPSQISRLDTSDIGLVIVYIFKNWYLPMLSPEMRLTRSRNKQKDTLDLQRKYCINIRGEIDSLIEKGLFHDVTPSQEMLFFTEKIYFKGMADLIKQYVEFCDYKQDKNKVRRRITKKLRHCRPCEGMSGIDKILKEPQIVIWLFGIVNNKNDYMDTCVELNVSTPVSDFYERDLCFSIEGLSEVLKGFIDFSIKNNDESVLSLIDENGNFPKDVKLKLCCFFQKNELKKIPGDQYIQIKKILTQIDKDNRVKYKYVEVLGMNKSGMMSQYQLTNKQVDDVLENKIIQPSAKVKDIVCAVKNQSVYVFSDCSGSLVELNKNDICREVGISESAFYDRIRFLEMKNPETKIVNIIGGYEYITRPRNNVTKINNCKEKLGIFYVIRFIAICVQTQKEMAVIKYGWTGDSTDSRIKSIESKTRHKELRLEVDCVIYEVADTYEPKAYHCEQRVLNSIREHVSPCFKSEVEGYSEIFLESDLIEVLPKYLDKCKLKKLYEKFEIKG
ncbi:hypothetical protein AB4298_20780 [Shewanella sp. 10N.261.52.F9]|uniref:hypothetical protein n=1 Tax=Shewanella sp. 10N.261.52.F9 TaxID=3229684 RepID=UPI003551E5C2